MIDNLRELNDTINNVVNFIVYQSTQKTSSGNYYMGYDDVSHLISKEDYLQYFDLIKNELLEREEVLDLEITDDHEFDAIYGLAWCPNYQWCQGDEAVFDMSEDEWEKNYQFESVAQPLSLSRKAEIADLAIPFIVSEMSNGLNELQDILGMSLEELEQMKILNNVSNLHENKDIPVSKEQESSVTFEAWNLNDYSISKNVGLIGAVRAYEAMGDVDQKVLFANVSGNKELLMWHKDGKDHMANINDLSVNPKVYKAFASLESYQSKRSLTSLIQRADEKQRAQIHSGKREKQSEKDRD